MRFWGLSGLAIFLLPIVLAVLQVIHGVVAIPACALAIGAALCAVAAGQWQGRRGRMAQAGFGILTTSLVILLAASGGNRPRTPENAVPLPGPSPQTSAPTAPASSPPSTQPSSPPPSTSTGPTVPTPTRASPTVHTPSQSATPTQSTSRIDFLMDLEQTSGSFRSGSKDVNGKTYADSIFHGLSPCNSGKGTGFTVEYNLSRHYSKFIATAGLSDVDTYGDPAIQFRVTTDQTRSSFELHRGEQHPVNIDLRGALYLRLWVYEPNSSDPCTINTVAVWGDARIVR